MKLLGIKIVNYRSIDQEVEIKTEPLSSKSCFFLFGINETGKSTILKACSFLDKNFRSRYNWESDCFQDNKTKDQETIVIFSFSLESTDLSDAFVGEKNILGNDALASQITLHGFEYTVKFKTDSTNTGHIDFEVPSLNLNDFFVLNDGVEGLSKISEDAQIKPEDKDKYQPLTEEVLKKYLTEKLGPILRAKFPKVIYWDSDAKDIVSKPIDINQFKADPTSSAPLLNIFKLAGIKGEAIAKRIDGALKNTSDRMKLNYELGENATKHINNVWKEHDVQITVTIEGNGVCTVLVADKDAHTNVLEMQQRSDGFQRFITFLLTLSANNLNEELKDALILLDEPEVHLHPSGVEYLRDELLKIAKNNYVIAASHSIFLVDKKCLQRHIAVSKSKGRTKITYSDPNDPFQEEVIFKGFNTSIFEIVQPYNVIFEGPGDGDVFQVVKNKIRGTISFPDVGSIGASGAPEIPKYTKFFNNKYVSAVVVVDSDREGRAALAQVKKDKSFSKNAFELKDLVDVGKEDFELEDLFSKDLVLDTAQEMYSIDFSGVDDSQLILKEISDIKHANKISEDEDLTKLKKAILQKTLADIKKLTVADFQKKYPNYNKFVIELDKKIQALSRG